MADKLAQEAAEKLVNDLTEDEAEICCCNACRSGVEQHIAATIQQQIALATAAAYSDAAQHCDIIIKEGGYYCICGQHLENWTINAMDRGYAVKAQQAHIRSRTPAHALAALERVKDEARLEAALTVRGMMQFSEPWAHIRKRMDDYVADLTARVEGKEQR